MFKVKATVTGFDKDEKKYPCHFRYKVGDEIVFDGVGFRSTPERPDEGYRFVVDETLFDTPPGGRFIIGKGKEKKSISLTCGDNHTLARFKVEAYDLADRGDALPYYRRAMSILGRIVAG